MKKRLQFKIIVILLFVMLLCQFSTFAEDNVQKDDKVTVLLYHHILLKNENKLFQDNGVVISWYQFFRQMKYLHDNGYNTLTMDEFYEYMYNGKEVPEKSVLITFDDGYYSNYHYAYGLMNYYDQKGAIFVITSTVNEVNEGSWNPDDLAKVDEECIAKMDNVFSFHSHTDDLHKFENNLPMLTSVNRERVEEDIKKSLEPKYVSDLAFAYPFGSYSQEVIEVLKENDIKLAFTVNGGYVEPNDNKYLINRFVIYPTTTMDQFIKIVEQEL